MSRPNRSTRVLMAAFAISLLLHLVFAVAYRIPRPRRSSDVETVTILRRSMAIVQRTPQPLPSATPKPHPRPQPSAPARKPAAHGFASGNGPGTPPPAPSSTPAPAFTVAAASPKPCAGTDIKSAVSQMPPQPDVPNAARTQGTGGIAAVDVRLDETGQVTAANVAHGTGNPALDSIAVSLARQAHYTPALHDCRAIASAYTFTVKFFAW